MKKLGLILSLTILVAALAAGPAFAEADISVSVKDRVVVAGKQVLLSDIATIDGPECAFKNDLSSIVITKAPKPGKSTSIRRQYLEHQLKASGLPLNMAKWRLSDRVVVERASQSITEDWARLVFEDFLAGAEPYKSHKWELIKLTTGMLPVLPAGDITYKISPRHGSSPSRLSADVHISVNGEKQGLIRVSGQIDLMVEAVTAARRIEKGEILTAKDFATAEFSLSRVPKGALTSVSQAIGLTSRVRLSPGEPVAERDLVKSEVIQRGDLVTITAEFGQVVVKAPGRAKRDGAVGETISVTNLSSNKVVVARILNSKTVTVQY